VLGDDFFGDDEAQTSAFLFCAVEWVEQVLEVVGSDPNAGVRNRHADSGRGAVRIGFRGDGEFSVLVHGFDGVKKKVKKNLLEMVAISNDDVRFGSIGFLDCKAFSLGLVLDEPQRIVQYLVQAGPLADGGGRFGKLEHLDDQEAYAVEFAPHDARELGFRVFFEQEIDKSFDRDKSIFDFVSDARRDDAERSQTIKPPQLGRSIARDSRDSACSSLLVIAVHVLVSEAKVGQAWPGVFACVPENTGDRWLLQTETRPNCRFGQTGHSRHSIKFELITC
jgi:hypothetical protein